MFHYEAVKVGLKELLKLLLKTRSRRTVGYTRRRILIGSDFHGSTVHDKPPSMQADQSPVLRSLLMVISRLVTGRLQLKGPANSSWRVAFNAALSVVGSLKSLDRRHKAYDQRDSSYGLQRRDKGSILWWSPSDRSWWFALPLYYHNTYPYDIKNGIEGLERYYEVGQTSRYLARSSKVLHSVRRVAVASPSPCGHPSSGAIPQPL